LLADDHTVVRQGLRKVLEERPDWKVVAEAGDGREAVRQAEQLKPDVAVLDVAMPLLNGLRPRVKSSKHVPGVRVLVLSMHADEAYVTQILQAGASGYLLKDSADVDLIQAVTAVSEGKSFFSPAIRTPDARRLREAAFGRDRCHRSVYDALGSRTRSLSADCRGKNEQGHRRPVVHQPQHGRNASRTYHGEARRSQRRGDRLVRGATRRHSIISSAFYVRRNAIRIAKRQFVTMAEIARIVLIAAGSHVAPNGTALSFGGLMVPFPVRHIFGLLLLLGLLVGCGGYSSNTSPSAPSPTPSPSPYRSVANAAPAPSGSTTTITIPAGASTLGTSAFVPNPTTITQAGVVTWTNTDSSAHDVVSTRVCGTQDESRQRQFRVYVHHKRNVFVSLLESIRG
jgi:DNA-binding NarL/FixJ family response regulator